MQGLAVGPEALGFDSTVVGDQEEFQQVLGLLNQAQRVVVDVETSGLKAWQGDRLCGVGTSLQR